ncbi:hypothetical protein KEM54_004274 [Ascosphaera aggregata]|nr:hypothetical protein KEM54_004274 [Ascosphaera aggregata]
MQKTTSTSTQTSASHKSTSVSSASSSSDSTSSVSTQRPMTTTAAETGNNSQNAGSSATNGVSAPASPTGIGDNSGSESTSKSSGISKGAIAGIVVGVVCGVGILVAILAWFLRRRRNSEQLPGPSSQAGVMPGAAANGLGSGPYNAPYVGYGPMMEGAAMGTAGGYMDSRMRKSSDIYDNADRRSNVSLRDDQDYSRPVLRLANPDPET